MTDQYRSKGNVPWHVPNLTLKDVERCTAAGEDKSFHLLSVGLDRFKGQTKGLALLIVDARIAALKMVKEEMQMTARGAAQLEGDEEDIAGSRVVGLSKRLAMLQMDLSDMMGIIEQLQHELEDLEASAGAGGSAGGRADQGSPGPFGPSR